MTPLPPLNLLLIGSCFLQQLEVALGEGGHTSRFVLQTHGAEPPPIDEDEIRRYDLQLAQIPLRAVLPDLALMRLRYDDVAGYEALFEQSRQLLDLWAEGVLSYHRRHGLPTLVCNLIRPQQGLPGRLAPKADIRNLPTYVDRLNQLIYEKIAGLSDAYILDIDEISASLGRMYQQDDLVWNVSHGSIVSDFDHPLDQDRLHRPTPLQGLYPLRTDEFMRAVVAEIEASARTLKQIDQVKLVVVDLDDTLWRGVAAERGEMGEIEGWPLGFVEALCVLRDRGVLLAIASKNDEARIEALWPQHFKGRLDLDAFVARRINWRPKTQNMAELLALTNLLPRSVVFIDDNPVERAAMAAAYPEMRILGAEPYLLRRILLWAPETQVATISTEAAERVRTTRAAIVRDDDRKRLSREDFLASLDLKVRAFTVASPRDRGFARAQELLNRSNQFNTTGRRWSTGDLEALLAGGGRLFAFEVEDRYCAYGLTGLAIVDGATIVQVVMSCRVFGLGVESAILSVACRHIAEGGSIQVQADLVETETNGPCRTLFADAGFTFDGARWWRPLDALPPPAAHIALAL